MIAPRFEVGQDLAHMFFEKQQVGQDHVCAGDGGFGLLKCRRVLAPLRRRMDRYPQPRKVLRKAQARPGHRPGRMGIQRDDHHVIGLGRDVEIIAHNGPLLRKASRR